jgi:hypothetical protein
VFLRFARLVPASGIAFVVLVVVASLIKDAPGTDASDAEILSYYQDDGNRGKELAAFFLVGVAALCFLSWLGSLRGFLARVEGEPARLTTATIAAGAAFITLAVFAHVAATAISWTVEAYERYEIDPDAARILGSVWYGSFVMSMFAAAAMLLSASVLALHSRVFPTWLAALGFLGALAGVLGFLVWPSLVILVWILAASVWMLRAASPVTPHQSAPAR